MPHCKFLQGIFTHDQAIPRLVSIIECHQDEVIYPTNIIISIKFIYFEPIPKKQIFFVYVIFELMVLGPINATPDFK